jgi:hypothetical protein
MPDENSNIVFDNYNDKINSLQKTIIIFFGVALFFFFMILIPYFSLKTDNHRILMMNHSVDQTRDLISFLNRSLFQEQAKSAKIIYFSMFFTKPIPKQYQNINKQYNDTISELKNYYHQLTDNKTSNSILNNMTYKYCNDSWQFRSPKWAYCNYQLRDKELKEKIVITNNLLVPLNNSIQRKLDNATKLQESLISEAQDFVIDTKNLKRIKDALIALKDPKNRSIPINNSKNLEDLQAKISPLINITNMQFEQIYRQIAQIVKQINNQTGIFETRFNQLDSPLGGTIPMGFNEMIAIFPLALAAAFLFVSNSIRETIRLRKILEFSQDYNIREYISNASSWIDPGRGKFQTKQISHSIIAWTVLAIPGIMFILSIILIHNMWYSLSDKADKFPVFTAASILNEQIYGILYAGSSIIFIAAYSIIISELKNK